MKCIRMRKGVIRVYSSLSSSVLSSSMAEWNVSWARSKWMVPVKNVAEACANRMRTRVRLSPAVEAYSAAFFMKAEERAAFFI